MFSESFSLWKKVTVVEETQCTDKLQEIDVIGKVLKDIKIKLNQWAEVWLKAGQM